MKTLAEWKQHIDAEYEKLKLSEKFSQERLDEFNMNILRAVQADAAADMRERAADMCMERGLVATKDNERALLDLAEDIRKLPLEES